MNRDWVILWIVTFFLLSLLIRFLYVEDVCEVVVDKHIEDTIPRTIKVASKGNILTGECSYKLISQTFEVK